MEKNVESPHNVPVPTLSALPPADPLFDSISSCLNMDYLDQLESTWEQIIDHFRINQAAIEAEINKGIKSNSLVKKSQALKSRKIKEFILDPKFKTKIDKILLEHFTEVHSKMSQMELKPWLQQHSRFALLNGYIDQQIVLEKTTKNAFIGLIKNKLQLEKIFLDFNYTQARFSFWYSALALTSALIGAGLGMVFGPMGIITGSVIGIYITSIIINFSFLIAKWVIGSKYRAHSSGLLNLKIMVRKVKYEISNYWLNVQKQKIKRKYPRLLAEFQRIEQSMINIEMTEDRIQKLLKQINLGNVKVQKKMEAFLRLQLKTQQRFKSMQQLKFKKAENEWLDFVNYAKLPADYLDTLTQNISLLNSDLLEKETSNFLKREVDLNFHNFKKELHKSPTEVKQILSKELQGFFTLNQDEYMSFMRSQNVQAHL